MYEIQQQNVPYTPSVCGPACRVTLPDLQGEPQYSSREKDRPSLISEIDLSRSKIYFKKKKIYI